MIIDGRKIKEELLEKLKARPIPSKFFAVVLVGNDEASKKFVLQKKQTAEFLGVDFRIFEFPEMIDEVGLAKEVEKISNLNECGGVIVQLPLPKRIDRDLILSAVVKEKDLDVLSVPAQRAFASGFGITPPPVAATLEILRVRNSFSDTGARYQSPANVSRETFAVVGNGFLIGKPVSEYLIREGKQVQVFDKGDDLSELKNADVVILGVGSPGLIKKDLLKAGALVIDFGCSFVDGKLFGDFDPEGADTITYTQTPGGTGPVLVAKLFENFYKQN